MVPYIHDLLPPIAYALTADRVYWRHRQGEGHGKSLDREVTP
ncbi:unnamed protein product [Penicillium roqueforti FM164]|uniref:Genomic scaffold, ProqFM164S01 n=1 Tax=Penicillium roqueforti (strain FM164) TaxID=1365484 RepID=W6Q1S4_PENRF|nr:unnamed protein product [Penicillium roqueforti FM164]